MRGAIIFSVSSMMTAIRLKRDDGRDKITGPVHGFLGACQHLGIELDTDHRGLTIQSPYGTKMAVLSADRTLYNIVVRDSIRYTILEGLQQRTATPGDPGYRKDMVRTGPQLDIKATRINLDAPLTKGHALFVDYSDSLNKHTFKAVLAGSLRAPDRLMAADIIDDDNCATCSVCCTTAHV